ncbi:hypothetical protein [Streptomyces sp. NPDC002619]|uniref:hypothetical protein n=1 Tax=Streptomyces sp. NPDC002619 TaxID=3364655 RepID=UPI00369046C0
MTDGEGGGGVSRAKTWLGIAALAAGCYTVGDASDRARAAFDVLIAWWPWALLGLAAMNIVRSAVPAETLLGPLSLAVLGVVGLTLSHDISTSTVRNVVGPSVLVLAGIALILAGAGTGPTTRWSGVLSSGQVVVRASAGRPLTVRAVLGNLRADLTQIVHEDHITVHITAFAGHVRLTVPTDATVAVHTTGAAFTRVTGILPQDTGGRRRFTLHVLGLCGALTIVRA